MRKLLSVAMIPGAVGGLMAAVAYNIVNSQYHMTGLPLRFIQESALTMMIFAVLGAVVGLVVGSLAMGVSRFGEAAADDSAGALSSAAVGFALAGGSLVSHVFLSAGNLLSEILLLAALVFTTIAAFALMRIWRPNDSVTVRVARWIGILGAGIAFTLWLQASAAGLIPIGKPGLIAGLAVAVGIGWGVWYAVQRLLNALAGGRSHSAAAIVAIALVIPLFALSARAV